MMQRVYGLVDDELVHRIDQAAGEAAVSRAQWIRIAIESYFDKDGEQNGEEAVKLREEAENLRTSAVNSR
jgi:metal-responsive CopG/Arc/MetJ family transcriptional regulator